MNANCGTAAREVLDGGVLVDFCAYLEAHHGLKVHDSWAALVDAFLAEYEEEPDAR